MYFPFLRGKQFELIALRESASDLAASGVIHPVIEPVRTNTDALARCLQVLAEQELGSTVIINPSEGEFRTLPDAPDQILQAIADSPDPWSVRPGILVTAKTDLNRIRGLLDQPGLTWGPTDLAHVDFISDTTFGDSVTEASHQFVSAKEVLRRWYDTPPPGQMVKWADPFPRRPRNLDYVDAQATRFTDDTIYFDDDGFVGFADYATIGREFIEGGSAPRAVVIHLTYPDAKGRVLIRHFASTSNEDTADPAGKFGEAVDKLVAFADSIELTNPAVETFQRHALLGTYPGLGVVKKLSIQNHFYVVMGILSK